MGNRYLKTEVEIIERMYPFAFSQDIMAALPGRNWVAVSRYARVRLGLHRSRQIKGLEMLAGREKAKRKREEKEKK